MKRILERYRTTPDFNGLHVTGGDDDELRTAIGLVRDGLVQVVSEADYPNPHIRPWPSKRTIEEQVASLEALDVGSYGVCLYPTPLALGRHRTRRQYPEQPFRQAMADGRGSLELAYFSFDVLEQYRNDPRFTFQFEDFGARTVVSDAVFEDEAEPERDKIIMRDIGFAYDLSDYNRDEAGSPIIRRVCAFYSDLAKLSPEHQQRWKTYELGDGGLEPHPLWWSQQMGHWADGLGPFQRFLAELEALNELFERAVGVGLFKTSEGPREFGWIVRPTQQEWDGFVHQLDKLLSDNVQANALDAAGAPTTNQDGRNLGSLNRLAALVTARGLPKDDTDRVFAPLRDVRKARQHPAHSLRTNVTDATFVHRQVKLLEDVTVSLEQLRRFWQNHPANRDWQEPPEIAPGAPSYRF